MEGQLILNRYRPLEELGEGGFGAVVLAWDTRMQRRVAVKRLPLPVDSSGNPWRPPGLSEARTAAMLNHPAIVTVFDFDTDEDEAFIVMEYIDGASLTEVLDAVDGPLTLDEAAAVAEAVADALDHAHENGVLHLDIKPDNVLISHDGRVKVTDFGISTLSSLGGHGPAYGGTPGYMPLEQLEGRQVTERTDEWAFGALVYEVLTGSNPMAQRTPQEALARLQVFEPPAPSEYEPDLSHAIDHAVITALGDRPADRYPSVGAFADELLPQLGDASAGQASLARIVARFVSDDEFGPQPGLAQVGLWDRSGGRVSGTVLRLTAVVESSWLAWTGLVPFTLDRPALLAASGLVAVAALLAPSLGVGLGLACLVAGLVARGVPVAGMALGILGAAWWWIFARRSPGAAVLPLAGPVLSAGYLGLAQPLLAGFALRPVAAAVTGLVGGVLSMLASAASLESVPYLRVSPPLALDVWHVELAGASLRSLATSPASYVALLGWPLAGAVMSLACSRATRSSAVLGAIGGAAALAGAYLLADTVATILGVHPPGAHWGGTPMGVAAGASLILVLLVTALGPPKRPEEDAVSPRMRGDDEDL